MSYSFTDKGWVGDTPYSMEVERSSYTWNELHIWGTDGSVYINSIEDARNLASVLLLFANKMEEADRESK